MMEKFKTWLKSRKAAEEQPLAVNVRKTGAHSFAPAKKAANVQSRQGQSDPTPKPADDKNVLIRNKYIREDTGTHETLKILDDSMIDSGEETGIDPYNTGGFDRSKNWNNRFRK